MAEALPIAIVGAGLMGGWHAQYAQDCGAVVRGIVDRSSGPAQRLAARFPGAIACSELDHLFLQFQPRVVHICTPLESHARIAEAALSAGASVIVEKPLAVDAAASRALLSMAERKGLLVAPTHQFLFQRGFLQARDALPALGRILHLDTTFCSAGGQRAGSGMLDDIATEILPHPLALIERLLPGSLEAFAWTVLRPLDGEWRILGAGNGVSVSILISLHGRPTESTFRIVTGGGVIELDLFHGFATIDNAPVSRATKIARPFRTAAGQFRSAGWNLGRRFMAREFAYPGLRSLISEFYAAVHRGAPAPISPMETLAVAGARDAVLQSAALGQQQGAL